MTCDDGRRLRAAGLLGSMGSIGDCYDKAWYNPRRRHSYCAMLSPIDYERAHIPAAAAA
jgi:putative transposase